MCLYTDGTVNSRTVTVSGSLHIYDDPDNYDVFSGERPAMSDKHHWRCQLQQLNPAHITIDDVIQRGNTSSSKLSYHVIANWLSLTSRYTTYACTCIRDCRLQPDLTSTDFEQENPANAKVSARQHCVDEGP